MANFTQLVNLTMSESVLRNVTIIASQIRNSTIDQDPALDETTFQGLRRWQPFQLDALGIVTLLGATQVDHTVGALSYNCFTQYLPLLGAYVFASNQFTQPINHGIVLYNISDGVAVHQFAGWFARWLLAQNVRPAGTNIELRFRSPSPDHRFRRFLVAFLLGIMVYGPMVPIGVLIRDYWGLVNILGLCLSAAVREALLRANRHGLDSQVKSINDQIREAHRELDYMSAQDQRTTRQRLSRKCQCLLLLPNGNKAYLQVSSQHWKACLTQTPPIARPVVYDVLRALGWLAFGLHVLSIGHSSFIIQVWTVLVLLGATILTTFGIGRIDSLYHWPSLKGMMYKRFHRSEHIGSSLLASMHQVSLASSDSVDVYAFMQLALKDEEKMKDWGLFPPASDLRWYLAYEKQKAFYQLPQNQQDARLAEQQANFERHRRDMKDRKRNANEDGEVEIPLMVGEDTEEMVEVMERGESSRSPFGTSQVLQGEASAVPPR